jgi:hypothetical protein
VIHYVSEPSHRAYVKREKTSLLSACGEVVKQDTVITLTPRLVECPACKRVMVGEEMRA